MTHEMAIKEILRNSLTQFDPEVVRAFQRCEERGEITGLASDPDESVHVDLPHETPAHVPVTAASAA
jgi:HD-GYP domain-containing protein (c-di-GMP phosphodiesterase class II)